MGWLGQVLARGLLPSPPFEIHLKLAAALPQICGASCAVQGRALETNHVPGGGNTVRRTALAHPFREKEETGAHRTQTPLTRSSLARGIFRDCQFSSSFSFPGNHSGKRKLLLWLNIPSRCKAASSAHLPGWRPHFQTPTPRALSEHLLLVTLHGLREAMHHLAHPRLWLREFQLLNHGSRWL